jgi:hypothetical protein
MIEPNVFDDAKRAFGTLPSGDTLVRAVAVLVRGGASEGEARSWAADAVRPYTAAFVALLSAGLLVAWDDAIGSCIPILFTKEIKRCPLERSCSLS